MNQQVEVEHAAPLNMGPTEDIRLHLPDSCLNCSCVGRGSAMPRQASSGWVLAQKPKAVYVLADVRHAPEWVQCGCIRTVAVASPETSKHTALLWCWQPRSQIQLCNMSNCAASSDC